MLNRLGLPDYDQRVGSLSGGLLFKIHWMEIFRTAAAAVRQIGNPGSYSR